MDNKEVIATHRMPDGTEYRVSITPDHDAQEPYDDGQWPILRIERHRGQGTYVEPFNDAAKGFEGKFAELMTRSTGYLAPVELFERYVRIFRGVTQFHTYGPNQGTDYTYLAFDTKAWREAMGWEDDALAVERMAEEKPLAEIQAYVEGDVWGWITEKRWNPDEDLDDDDWEAVESVWGYYGASYAKAEAESNLGTLVDNHKLVHRYTEHEKITAHQSAIRAILEFLETHTLQGHTAVQGGQEQMVYEHFGIDYAKIKAERELMLQTYQEDANDKPTPE